MEPIKIGADVVYIWEDNPSQELHGYISFADWEDDADEDAYGVNDLDIFFFSSEAELPELMKPHNGSDFRVLSFEYRMADGGG
jgi:hypothetical protein